MDLVDSAISIMQEWLDDSRQQICLRDALIDDLVKQMDIWKGVAAAEADMSEVLRKELAKVVEELEDWRQFWVVSRAR